MSIQKAVNFDMKAKPQCHKMINLFVYSVVALSFFQNNL